MHPAEPAPGGRPRRRAAAVGLAGHALAPGERELLGACPPACVILFARNCAGPAQLGALVADLRAAAAHERLPVLIDQEGGRVARLRPPAWRPLPPMGAVGGLAGGDRAAARRAAALAGGLIAHDLAAAGIDVACAPVLDVLRPGATTAAIGDRSFGPDPGLVAELGGALADALLAGGVRPVMKHCPGHGAARVDSHEGLPAVDLTLAELRAVDFVPFRALRRLPLAMTAHVVYSRLDPDRPATLSPRVIAEVIRGEIGFEGVLFTDDLGMGALRGPLAERAQAALAAGCDVALTCGGGLEDSRAVLAAAPELPPAVAARLDAPPPAPGAVDLADAAAAELGRLLIAAA